MKGESRKREAAHLSAAPPGTCVPGQASKRAEQARWHGSRWARRQPQAHDPAATREAGRLFRANFPAENVKTAASLEFIHL